MLPSRDVIVRKIGFGDASCVICDAEEETLFHIFKECPGALALAFGCKWGFRLDRWSVSSIYEIVDFCIFPKMDLIMGGMDSNSTFLFIYSFLYICWMLRNMKMLSGK